MLGLPYSACITCGGCLWWSFLISNCTWGGGCAVSLLWWVLRWWYLWKIPLMHSEVVCLCDGKLDVFLPCWDDEPFCLVLVWLYSPNDSQRFLCVVSLRGLLVPVNLFLLHNWVITLVLRSLVRVAWFDWEWGHFKIYFGMCDLTLTFIFSRAVLTALLFKWGWNFGWNLTKSQKCHLLLGDFRELRLLIGWFRVVTWLCSEI